MPRAKRANERRGHAGHTLTEMLVALAILGVSLGAVVPALVSARGEDGVTRASRTLAELLHHTRARAADLGVVVTLVVDPASGRGWIAEGSDAPLVQDSMAVSLVAVLADARNAGEVVGIASDRARVRWTFTPSGLAFGEPVVVYDATHSVIVGVNRWTGEVHAQPR
ncbi:MAG TPA: type II secretion system protein [Gemmatimonadaceae bacterium]|nr:type II secretion system protein [Gemmatimonadaceae bacterium]